MRTLFIGAVAAFGIAVASPAAAQGFYFGGPGISVGVGAPGPYYGYGYRYGPDPYYYGGPRAHYYYDDGPRTYAYAPRVCRTLRVQRPDGSFRRVTRCR